MTKGRGPKRPVTKHGGGWFKLLFGDHKPAGRGPAGTGTAGVTGSTVANLRQGLEASTVALGLLLWQAPCLVLEFGALKGMPSLRLAAAVRTSRPVKQRIANNKAHDPPPLFLRHFPERRCKDPQSRPSFILSSPTARGGWHGNLYRIVPIGIYEHLEVIGREFLFTGLPGDRDRLFDWPFLRLSQAGRP